MMLVLLLMVACAGAALIPEPEVQIQVLEKPFLCKRKTKNGDMLLVHFEGFLESNGTQFHSTYVDNNGQPVWFTLGIQEVIKGWDKGLKDMCVGEKRNLTIPAALAYGKEGKGNADRYFLVKAYLKAEFEKHDSPVNDSHHDVLVESIFEKEDEDSDGFISAREFTYVHDEL
ncbi:hypothetical protein GDO78_002984 [Eleutherodactylus coqui]|uniref:peptidylprolyl isomerase n=1 Tax=Eleutherodactylus coqui TaxID=57060 RepID=A0A8J6EWU7_ELECQ|nr:hypothetical protein GDO78_002984 [Eleutherodactylus coqui]